MYPGFIDYPSSPQDKMAAASATIISVNEIIVFSLKVVPWVLN